MQRTENERNANIGKKRRTVIKLLSLPQASQDLWTGLCEVWGLIARKGYILWVAIGGRDNGLLYRPSPLSSHMYHVAGAFEIQYNTIQCFCFTQMIGALLRWLNSYNSYFDLFKCWRSFFAVVSINYLNGVLITETWDLPEKITKEAENIIFFVKSLWSFPFLY